MREALVGNADLAKRQAQEVLALSTGRDVEALSSVALGLTADVAHAARVADDLGRRFPRTGRLSCRHQPKLAIDDFAVQL